MVLGGSYHSFVSQTLFTFLICIDREEMLIISALTTCKGPDVCLLQEFLNGGLETLVGSLTRPQN